MAEKKKKEDVFISPRGVAKYVHLNTPQTKVGDNPCNPNYSVTLLLDPDSPEAISFVAAIEAAHAAGFSAAKSESPKRKYTDMGLDNCFKPDTDKDGAPTGKLALKFKASAGGKRKDGSEWTFKPSLFNGQGAGLPGDAVVFGGSTLAAAYSIRHTPMPTGSFYTSLNLKAAMVYDLKSSYERAASDFGFQVEDQTDAFGEEQASIEGGADASAPTDF